MAELTCPVCATTAEPAAQVGQLVVCAHCGTSIWLGDEEPRQATAVETTTLSEVELRTLRRARGAIVRPQ